MGSSARISRAAANRLSRATRVSGRPRVFRPQSRAAGALPGKRLDADVISLEAARSPTQVARERATCLAEAAVNTVSGRNSGSS
ncbi:hypothetical protein N7925_05055 [Streptomyces sp. CA-278952]|uniref:hypothetical protein n=1 Tax=unclassified Streptomyces TaxID=2593676 RepID=UPI002367F972|nr:hypothetical protein [Streptomyces sp. CA-278952]WDG27752.1 hypothetical protein N7925_05055 [Streptomyces sp. CA-278952]